MRNQLVLIVAAASAACLLAGCSGGDNDNPQNANPAAVELPRPTPMLKGIVEISADVPASQVQAQVRTNAVSSRASLLATTTVSVPKEGTISAISTADPRSILFNPDQVGANPWQPRGDKNLKLVSLPRDETQGRLPTGKWSKGAFYQSPSNIDAYFQPNLNNPPDPRNQDSDTAKFSIFPFPNKLKLDDRIGMVSISFPRGRYIDINSAPDASIYDLSNPYKADLVPYTMVPSPAEDLRLSYVQPDVQRLARQVDEFDELSISTSWTNPAGNQRMTVLAAEGSPFVTVRYAELRPVIQAGQGILARTPKDGFGIPNGATDYSQLESDNGIEAVAVGEQRLEKFQEFGAGRNVPALTGKKFRFLYSVPDKALARPGTNDGNIVAEPSAYKEAVVYASSEITLEWDAASRSYVSPRNFTGVIRTAFVDEVPKDGWTDETKLGISNRPSFMDRRNILENYKNTFPTSSHIQLAYDGGETATVIFKWDTEQMEAGPGSLLMMGFDATHIPSLQNANRVSGLSYPSNFGSMSAVAGDSWTQKLTIPAILREAPTGKALWPGSTPITQNQDVLKTYLARDTQLYTTYVAHCNYESYLCGKYLYNIARLAIIAGELGETSTRQTLLDYLKQNLKPWFDGVDPSDPKYATSPIKEHIVYDTTNGGIIALRAYKNQEDDFHNAWYVDHMFHYGYYIYASAVLAAHDPAWRDLYKEKVNLLVRDIANPSLDDRYFPLMRHFDWYRMQNLADSGPDANGANTESSSESIHASYALGLWGAVLGNSEYQALAAIMTAGEIRTAQAFYQITPHSLIQADVAPTTVTVKLPQGSASRLLDPMAEMVRPIIRANIAEQNIFFGARLVRHVGIELLPISPISEYVISPGWAMLHAQRLKQVEDVQTSLFDQAIGKAPTPSSPCFLQDYDGKSPIGEREPAIKCTTPLKVEYSWRQTIFAATGITDPTAFNRYLSYAGKRQKQEDDYFEMTREVSDVLKDTTTPSTETNTLWWLSVRKPR